MPKVKLTTHLYRYFPELEQQELWVEGKYVKQMIDNLDVAAPGIKQYLLEDSGAVRRHVLVSIHDTLLIDRKTLSDNVPPDATLYIFQALTGG
ncbi:MoaD/ThiS family protein [Catenovulum sp. 2E275]|uniref:MoaD/ThiS family protein n=1 Tax=Catenovulum sp. 2E275 TaxID=2980497 RepID=UPI0021D168D5|nr:MoaD/ThiS family protein [Catenovulum sp. 2E275]MCU4677264.1 MoaD/ThiS family protein [Catenovulum sp. 2E275]